MCAGSCYRLGFMLSCLGGLQIQHRNVDHHHFEEFVIKNKEKLKQTKTNTETEHTNKVETVTYIKERWRKRENKNKKDSKTKPNSNQGHGGWVGWLGTQQSAHRNLTPVHSGQSCEQCAGVKVCNIIFS